MTAENPHPLDGGTSRAEPLASNEARTGITRRGLLTYALSAPVLTVGAGLALPRDAMAALPLTPPDTTDFFDLGDAITLSALPTMPLVRLSVGTNGRVAFELPRAESGQGITTAQIGRAHV